MENVNIGILEICKKYTGLRIINSFTITGSLQVDKVVNDEHIKEFFKIEIDFSDRIPIVKELSGKINGYHHKYKNGNLCLETNLVQLLYLKEKSYLEWFEYFVINYFCSFCYYQKYKCFPYGEREHSFGEFHSFTEFVNLDTVKSWKILEYILNNKYRGHNQCPCGSGKNVRSCHKDIIQKFQQDKELYEEIKKIYIKTKGELNKNEKKQQKRKQHIY